MKTWTIAKWSLGIGLAVLPLIGGCVQESANSAPVPVTTNAESSAALASESQIATNVAPLADTNQIANVPPPEIAVQELETAPGKVVSTPTPATQAANLSPSAGEVVKLAQAGLDDNVMLAFVTNSPHTFNLSSDQIIYLNDIGVSGEVVSAMLQHDQALSLASTPPPEPPVETEAAPVEESNATAAVEAPLTPPESEIAQPQVNVTYSYFYDTLAPYGAWVDIDGYGRCWRPTVVTTDTGWTPYATRGHWVYSDCGWYWASDYSWGWAPFHYGRWFRHNYWGWCWAPDTVWGPAWVSWRYTPGYCGWAPLPPTACYRPGIGFTYFGRPVGASFSYGIGLGAFTFVAADHFCDPHPFRHRVPHQHVTQIFNQTTIINPEIDRHEHSRFHKGIPRHVVAEATHRDIKPVRIHETRDIPRGNRGEHFDPNRDTLTVFRPHLPEPNRAGARVGQGVKPAAPSKGIPNFTLNDHIARGANHKAGAEDLRDRNSRFNESSRDVHSRVTSPEITRPANPAHPWQPAVGARQPNAGRIERPNPVRPETRNPHAANGPVQPNVSRNPYTAPRQPAIIQPRTTPPQRTAPQVTQPQRSSPMMPAIPQRSQPNALNRGEPQTFPRQLPQAPQRSVSPHAAIGNQAAPRVFQQPARPALPQAAPAMPARPSVAPAQVQPSQAPARSEVRTGGQFRQKGGR